MQADLLYKRYTGHQKAEVVPKTPKNALTFSSFNDTQNKEKQKVQVHGLNRMDLDTFILALSEIA